MSDINEKLARALGYDIIKISLSGVVWAGNQKWIRRRINYRSPAIRCECEDWLLDNGYEISKAVKPGNDYLVLSGMDLISQDKCIYKAAALAVIEAKK